MSAPLPDGRARGAPLLRHRRHFLRQLLRLGRREREAGGGGSHRAVGEEPAAPFHIRRIVRQRGERAAQVGDFAEGIGGGHELAVFIQRFAGANRGEVEQPLRRLLARGQRRRREADDRRSAVQFFLDLDRIVEEKPRPPFNAAAAKFRSSSGRSRAGVRASPHRWPANTRFC